MNYFLLTSFICLTMVTAGCQAQSPATPTQPVVLEEKQGETTKTGVIIENNGQFLLQAAGAAPLGIDSYSVELKDYTGQTVTVTGQYSGDTLFVGQIE